MTEFRVCIKCDPPHVENCSNCFGFGFHENGMLIIAAEAGDSWQDDKKWISCPVCKGTPKNEHIEKMLLEIRHDFILNGNPSSEEKPTGILKM
jgi:hypothetical protein